MKLIAIGRTHRQYKTIKTLGEEKMKRYVGIWIDRISKIAGVYTRDKMTANQVSVEVKAYFDQE